MQHWSLDGRIPTKWWNQLIEVFWNWFLNNQNLHLANLVNTSPILVFLDNLHMLCLIICDKLMRYPKTNNFQKLKFFIFRNMPYPIFRVCSIISFCWPDCNFLPYSSQLGVPALDVYSLSFSSDRKYVFDEIRQKPSTDARSGTEHQQEIQILIFRHTVFLISQY